MAEDRPVRARETVLTPLHRAAAAPLVAVDGFLLPERFGDPALEDRFLRETVGVIDESHRGVLDLRGKKVTDFLQRLLSSDVKRLAPGRGQPSCLLTGKGKLVAAFELYRTAAGPGEEAFRILFGEPLREEARRALEKYAALEDLQAAEPGEGGGLLSVQGVRAGDLFRSLLESGSLPGEPFREEEVVWGGFRLSLRLAGATPAGGFEVRTPSPALWERLVREARALGGGPVGFLAAEPQRIESGVGRFGVDYDGSNFPNEAGWEEALSYEKGCYIGQEVIARMRTYGHLNRRLMALRLPAAPLPPRNTRLYLGGKELGSLSSSARPAGLESGVGLAFLRSGGWEPGVRLSPGSPESPAEAVVSGPARLRGSTPQPPAGR